MDSANKDTSQYTGGTVNLRESTKDASNRGPTVRYCVCGLTAVPVIYIDVSLHMFVDQNIALLISLF